MKPALMLALVVGMIAEPTIDTASAENLIRYVLTQGGLTSLLLFLGWSYRRDFIRLSDAKAERISLLMEMNSKSTEAQTKTADALLQSTAALSTQAESIRQMSNALMELKGAIVGRRSADGHA